MSINYTNDILPLYATNVITDAEYLAIEPTRRDNPFEQKVLAAIEIMRGLMAELNDEDQARMLHYAMGRMLAAIPYGPVYGNGGMIKVVGNTTGAYMTAKNGDTLVVVDGSGSDTIALALAPYTDLNALVAEINGAWVNVVDVDAYNDNGRLGFRNAVGSEGKAFALARARGNGAGNVLDAAGIQDGAYYSPVETYANTGRDDAIALFEKASNPSNP